jgi:hypothetical protein
MRAAILGVQRWAYEGIIGGENGGALAYPVNAYRLNHHLQGI